VGTFFPEKEIAQAGKNAMAKCFISSFVKSWFLVDVEKWAFF
jgi:hypothetical protein